MLDALVRHAQNPEFSKLLPPTGFYNYSQPIRWVVQISETGARLEESNLEGLLWARPYSNRTSGTEAYPLADEAAYALGVEKLDSIGNTASKVLEAKHPNFLMLLDKILSSEFLEEDLKQSVNAVKTAIKERWLEIDPRFQEINAKDWVAFELTYGSFKGKRLFQLPEIKAFWVSEAQERIAVRDEAKNIVYGECAVCGVNKPLIGRIPVGVKLISKPGPLHSLNKTAFVSGRSITDGHNSLCYECADTASRAFNALSSSKQNRRIIVMDKSAGGKVQLDSLRNQVALFWLEGVANAVTGDILDFEGAFGDLMRPAALEEAEDTAAPADTASKPKGKKTAKSQNDQLKPTARISQLSNLLNVQRDAKTYLTNLDEAKFALAIFSPNVGRTALREWMYLDLKAVLPNVAAYLNATNINDAWGHEARPQPINALMEALDSKNANMTRDLIRTAYQGYEPPNELLALAVQRFRTLTVKGTQDKQLVEWERQRHLYALAAALKLSLYYKPIKGGEGAAFMTGLNRLHDNPAYLCGRLLAVLEEAQQVYTYHQGGKRLKTTTAQRSFGTASTAPQGIMPRLVRLATVAHLPRAGKNLNVLMETLVRQIVAQDGYPQSLNMQGQGNFGLGYWQQRGEIRASWSEADKQADAQSETEPEGASA